MIQYGKQNIDEDDVREVSDVLRSDFLTQGPKVKEFEARLAECAGATYAVAVSNGTTALHLAYLAAGIGEGDEVITTPNTFVATTNMLLVLGAKPVFCDINLETYNLDEKKIESLITPKTKAIVPVDFAGRPCEYDRILEIAKKHNLLVISDGCHALGAQYRGRPVGSIADMTVFSFHPVKAIATGEGGAVVTNNKEYYEKMLLLRSHGVHKNEEGVNVMTELGYNYRIPDILAALGVSQLRKVKQFLEKRQEVVRWYRESLSDIAEISMPLESDYVYSGWHVYVIRTNNSADRRPLYDHLQKAGIGANFHYPAVYKHPYYEKLGYGDANCPNMNIYHDSCITLPCHTLLTKEDVERVSGLIKDFF